MSIQSLIELHTIPALAPGATHVEPHTLSDSNGPIVPNVIVPVVDGSPVVPDQSAPGLINANTVQFRNTSAQVSLPVTFRVEYEFTPQRSSAQGAAGLNYYYAGPDGGGVSGGSFLELSGQQDVAGNVVPVDTIYDYYIQSDMGVTVLGPAATYGSDSNPGTKDLPFLTAQGAIQRAVRQGVQGAQIRLHYGGYSVRPPGGWPVAPIAANDPWDGYPTERRRYTQRDIRLTGMEAFQAAYSFLGPRKMFPSTAVLTYLGATQVGQRVRLDFVEAAFGAGAIGTYIGMRKIADDRDILFPHVISEVIAPNSIMVEPPFSAAAWDALYAAENGYFRGLVPAVEISGDWDYENSGVVIHGDGAGLFGGGRVGGGPMTRNPTPHIAYMMVIRPHIVATGQVYFASTWLDDGTVFVSQSEPRLAGCSGGPNGFVKFKGNGRVLADDSDKLSNLEVTGWALVASVLPSPTADPVFQNGGPGELVVTGLAQMLFGESLASRGGRFRVLHGLSVITADGRQPIQLWGKDAALFVSADVARPAHLVVHGAGARPCIWACGGAVVYTNAAQMELQNGGGGTLRVGKGAAIGAGAGAGEFLDPAGYAGNFTRRLENAINPGFADDDTSEIIDATWMPAGYAGVT